MSLKKMYIGNLEYSITDSQLQELFSEYGTVKELKLFPEKGFGFIEMDTQAEAENARAKLNGHMLGGRALKVDIARPPKQRRNFRRH